MCEYDKRDCEAAGRVFAVGTRFSAANLGADAKTPPSARGTRFVDMIRNSIPYMLCTRLAVHDDAKLD